MALAFATAPVRYRSRFDPLRVMLRLRAFDVSGSEPQRAAEACRPQAQPERERSEP